MEAKKKRKLNYTKRTKKISMTVGQKNTIFNMNHVFVKKTSAFRGSHESYEKKKIINNLSLILTQQKQKYNKTS